MKSKLVGKVWAQREIEVPWKEKKKGERVFSHGYQTKFYRSSTGKRIRKKSRKKDCRNPGLNQGPLDLQSNALPTELGSGEDILMEGGKGGKRRREEKEEGNNPKSHCNAPKITPEVHCHLLMILMLVFLFIVCVCCLLFVFLFVYCLLYLLVFVVCVYAHAQFEMKENGGQSMQNKKKHHKKLQERSRCCRSTLCDARARSRVSFADHLRIHALF